MTDPVALERLGTALAGRYRMVRELGRGGMATVYLADDPRHRRQVAVKVLHPALAAAIGSTRFVREIGIAARLSHPHILPLFDSGDADGFLYYVMPFVPGASLRQRLLHATRLPLAAAVRIVEQVASALAYAHEQGIVHRDIKPENILLSNDQAVVADFGIARVIPAVADGGGGRTETSTSAPTAGPATIADAAELTGSGLAIGTPAYMSPEQAFGQPVDGRTDVYALGCVLFEMLAGRPPFRAGTPQAVLAQHAVEAVPSLRGLCPDLPLFAERAVTRALAKAPASRFASPVDLAETLRAERVVAPVGRKRIAVLPPVNVTNDPDQQFLVLGLHETLISHLARGDVAVLARASVLHCHHADRPVRDVCRELAVDAVVESSLLRSGDLVAVHARLIDGATEEGVWSTSDEGEVRDILSVYRRLGASMATAVDGAPAPPRWSGARPAVDPVAYEKYLRGRVYQQSFNPHDLDRALRYYEAALAIQPDYAPAHAGTALVWGSKIVLGLVPALEAGPRYRETAARAVALDPGLAEGHQALAQVYFAFEFDWERAEASFQRAIELDPNEPQTRIFYSHLLATLRRTEESDQQIRRALEIDPFNPFTELLYGVQLGLTGRYAQSLEQLAAVPPNPLGALGLAVGHFHLGQHAEGLRHYLRHFEMLGDQAMVSALGSAGADPKAAMIRGAEVLVERSRHAFVKPNHIVHLFSWGGDLDRAIEWLERSYRMRDHEVAYVGTLGSPPELRADPRFQALARALRLPWSDPTPRSDRHQGRS
ncbi:MAG: protein kinase [Vicinamibacterales bacterium]